MTATAHSELLAFAHELADDAAALARRWFRGDAGVEQKGDRTPVTAADRAIERRWRERIGERFPGHGILGEEEGARDLDAEWLWVLDPIDGTKAFASGNPMFGCLLGVMHRGRPVVGVLEAPALGERWSAAQGHPAEHRSSRGTRAIAVRAPRSLDRAVAYCTSPDALLDEPGFQRLRRRVQWTSYGSDCIAYALVAMGGVDLLVDRGLEPYDWCALVPIVEAAGGVIADWQGRPLSLASNGEVLAASDAALAAAAREVLHR